MKREIGDYVQDIVETTEKLATFVKGISYNGFREDDKTVFAVVRALEIIGEAVKNIPDGIRKKYPKIPWKDIAGMRDKLIHEYFGIKIELLWKAVKEEIPPIKHLFKKILKDL